MWMLVECLTVDIKKSQSKVCFKLSVILYLTFIYISQLYYEIAVKHEYNERYIYL